MPERIGDALEQALRDALPPEPTEEGDVCPTCGTDRIRSLTIGARTFLVGVCCPCQEAVKIKAEHGRFARSRQAEWQTRAGALDLLLPAQAGKLWDLTPPQADAIEPYKALARWVKRWPHPDKAPQGVIVRGPSGVGKSTLVRGAAREVEARHDVCVAYFRGTKWEALTASEIRACLPVLQAADLLVYDELGKESMRGNVPGWLMELFSERSDNKRPTLFTMNHNDQGLEERWVVAMQHAHFTEDQARVDVPPLISRVYGGTFLLEFNGRDLRLPDLAPPKKA